MQVVPHQGRKGIRRREHSIAIARYQTRLRDDRPAADRPQPGDGHGREADRCVEVHRLQGMSDGMHGMERSARRSRSHDRHLRQPARPDGKIVDCDALHRIREPERRPRMADPQGRLHALRGSGLSEGVSFAGHDRAVQQRHRGFSEENCIGCGYCVDRLPVQYSAHLEGRQSCVQVHILFGSRGGGTGTGVREDVPDRRDHVCTAPRWT